MAKFTISGAFTTLLLLAAITANGKWYENVPKELGVDNQPFCVCAIKLFFFFSKLKMAQTALL